MATRFERLYEEDFYAWTREQAKALRRLAETRPQVEIDFRHLAEEIRDLGKERRDALRGRATRVIEHLPLLEHSAARDPRRCSGVGGIVDFRRDIEERLTKTLRRDLARQLPRLYSQARRGLVRKLAAFSEPEAAAALPAECPTRSTRCSATGGQRRGSSPERAATVWRGGVAIPGLSCGRSREHVARSQDP